MKQSVVYFVREATAGNIKIGVTTNFRQRMADLRQQNTAELEPIGFVNGDAATEGQLHQIFNSSRISGEWFHPTAELMAYIDSRAQKPEALPIVHDAAIQDEIYWPVLAALKSVPAAAIVRATGCTARSAENWRSGATQPSAVYLLTLMANVAEVADAILEASGRNNTGKLSEVQRRKLLEILGED